MKGRGNPVGNLILLATALLAFGAWTLWRSRTAAESAAADADGITVTPRRSAFVAIALAFFVSEFGDKTQLAVATLATTRNAFFTWFGAVIGMVVADSVAIAAGAGLRKVLRPRLVAVISATGFTLTGVVLLVSA